jgi:predicted O-linked N-acetylglucosamine transferase (SPINDLY family)
MGVPVVTCPGTTFAGRVSASLVSAMGLDELVAATFKDYEALALALARDPARAAAAKAKLAAHRAIYPLFDTARFTHHLDAAYRTMWAYAQRGLPPADIIVPAQKADY